MDFGNIQVPTSWDEVTLYQLQQLEKTSNPIDIISILINKDRDYVMSLPDEFMDIINSKLAFMQSLPDYKPAISVTIDNLTYSMNTREKLRLGEFTAADMVIKQDSSNYSALLAILLRLPDEKYDTYFENEVLPQRIELFKKLPVSKALPVMNFFLICWLTQQKLSQSCMTAAQEVVNLIQKNIDSLQSLGAGKRLSMIWQIVRLQKLKKYIKNTYQI